jgi:cellulose synthase operon protein C
VSADNKAAESQGIDPASLALRLVDGRRSPGRAATAMPRARWRPSHVARAWIVDLGAVGSLVALWLVWGASSVGGGGPARELARLAERSPARTHLGRLHHPALDRHRPYARDAPALPAPGRLLARLERQGDPHALAAAFFLAGWNRQAELRLEKLPQTGAVLTDRAAIALAERAPRRALALLDSAPPEARRSPRALWNRALALAALDLPLGAAHAWHQVAALGEPGWAEEARQHAKVQRGIYRARRDDWERHHRHRLALMEGRELPSAAIVRDRPDLWRDFFYDLVRTARSPQRLAALAPLATQLGSYYREEVFARSLREAGRASFAERGPLAARYAGLLAGGLKREEVATLIEDLRRSRQRDILFGALVTTQASYRHLEAMRAAASSFDDAWLSLIAEEHTAMAEVMADSHDTRSVARLRRAIADCDSRAYGRRCLALRLRLSYILGGWMHQLREGIDRTSDALTEARERSDVAYETVALSQLATGAAGTGEPSLVRAYLEENVLAEPGSCAARTELGLRLASIALQVNDVTSARAEIARLRGCPIAGLFGLRVLARLARFGTTAEQASALREALVAARTDVRGSSPSQAAALAALEGLALLDGNREEGLARLRLVRPDVASLPRDNLGSLARWLTHPPLILDAIDRTAPGDALELLLELEGVVDPGGCLLALASHGGRAMMAARGPWGDLRALSIEVPASRPRPGPLPGELERLLRTCPEVRVAAAQQLHGTPRLLPRGWAWSYLVPGKRPAPPEPARRRRRLVVANVQPPAERSLDPLAIWRPQPRPDEEIVALEGRDATPERVLRELPDVDEVEFHVHGLHDAAVSETPFLVLSPGGDGKYALTEQDVRRVSFRRAPLVILAACQAGQNSQTLFSAASLPLAFLQSGAATVVAAPALLPDVEAGRLLERLGARIATGTSPAVTLAGLRQEQGPHAWFEDVVLFQ